MSDELNELQKENQRLREALVKIANAAPPDDWEPISTWDGTYKGYVDRDTGAVLIASPRRSDQDDTIHGHGIMMGKWLAAIDARKALGELCFKKDENLPSWELAEVHLWSIWWVYSCEWEEIEQGDIKKAQDLLRRIMGEISEAAISAGWLNTLEYDLWDFIENGAGQFGRLLIEPNVIRDLKWLADKAGGWWTYEKFVPMQEWVEMYQEYIREGDW